MYEITPLDLQIEVTHIICLNYKYNLKEFENVLRSIIKPYLKKQEYFDVIDLVREKICDRIRVQHSTDIRLFGSIGFIPSIIVKRRSEVNKKSVLASLQQ